MEKPPATMLDPGGQAGVVVVADSSTGSAVCESTSLTSGPPDFRQ